MCRTFNHHYGLILRGLTTVTRNLGLIPKLIHDHELIPELIHDRELIPELIPDHELIPELILVIPVYQIRACTSCDP